MTSEILDPREAARGRLLVAVAAVMWSLSGVFARGLSPLTGAEIAFYRSLFAGLALLPFVPPSRWRFRPAMVPLVAIFGAMVGAYLIAITRTSAANAILLQYSATFWTVPLGLILLKERPDRRDRVPIALATLGIVLLVAFGRNGTPGEGLGIVSGLASGLGYATVIVGMRLLRDLDPAWLSAASNLGGALFLGALTWMIAGPIHPPTGRQAIVLILFGVVQMAIPYALFARGLKTIGAAEAGLLTLLEPVLMPFWVFLVHGEVPASATIAGGLLLIAGVAVRYRPRPAAKLTEAG